ncbi:hypothetical protein DAMA08_009620 [Martiniozyma asiatica (nom. inval.)]|nr:hypothetical protein DAMA08_009620 [Martiniozyma asiatica]
MIKHSTALRRFSTTITKFNKNILNEKTIGEIEDELNTMKGTYMDKLTKSQTYKSFFDDFKNAENITQPKKSPSVQEQKTFSKVFDFLFGNVDDKNAINEASSKIGINPAKFKSGYKFDFFGVKTGPINQEKKYQEKLTLNKSLIEALSPTLNYINKNIKTSTEMDQFVSNIIIKSFLQNHEYTKGGFKFTDKSKVKSIVESIEKKSLESPDNPLVNKFSLPILLKFCFTSLSNDFNSFLTIEKLVNKIKEHPSIELFGYGMNIDVYNALILHTWKKTENLVLIVKLIDELKVNAVEPDLYTYKILAEIYLQCMRIQNSTRAQPYLLWCDRNKIYQIKNYLDAIPLL